MQSVPSVAPRGTPGSANSPNSGPSRTRLRLLSTSPHNPDRRGTTPAQRSAFWKAPIEWARVCHAARLGSTQQWLLCFLAEYLFGMCAHSGDSYQLEGVPTSYREAYCTLHGIGAEDLDDVEELDHMSLGRSWAHLGQRRIVVRRLEEGKGWRGGRGYRYHLAHPDYWDSEEDAQGAEEPDPDGGRPHVWLDWQGRPTPVWTTPRRAKPTGPPRLPDESENPAPWPVDNHGGRCVPACTHSHGHYIRKEDIPGMNLAMGDCAIDDRHIDRWVGQGRRERRNLLTEVRRWLKRELPCWEESLSSDRRRLPPRLVAKLTQHARSVNAAPHWRWDEHDIGRAIARCVDCAEHDAAVERELAALEAAEVEVVEERSAAEVLAQGEVLLGRASDVLTRAKPLQADITKVRLVALGSATIELSRALQPLREGNLAELALAVALLEMDDWTELVLLEYEIELAAEARPEVAERIGAVKGLDVLDIAGRGVEVRVPDESRDPVEVDTSRPKRGDATTAQRVPPERGRILDFGSRRKAPEDPQHGPRSETPWMDPAVTVHRPKQRARVDAVGPLPSVRSGDGTDVVRGTERDAAGEPPAVLVGLRPPDAEDHLTGDIGDVLDIERHEFRPPQPRGEADEEQAPIPTAGRGVGTGPRHRRDFVWGDATLRSAWGPSVTTQQGVLSPMDKVCRRRGIKFLGSVLPGDGGEVDGDG